MSGITLTKPKLQSARLPGTPEVTTLTNTLDPVSVTALLPAKIPSVAQISDTVKTVLVRRVVAAGFKPHRFTTGNRGINS